MAFLGICLYVCLTNIYITVPSQERFPEISVSSVAKNDRVDALVMSSWLKLNS